MKKIITLIIILATLGVAEAVVTTITHTTVTTTTNSATALAANLQRNFLLLINDSDTVIYCKFGATAVANEGLRIAASGGSLLLDVKVPKTLLNCINGTGSKVLLVSEGVGP